MQRVHVASHPFTDTACAVPLASGDAVSGFSDHGGAGAGRQDAADASAGLSRLLREVTWLALRSGRLPEPLPEGLPPATAAVLPGYIDTLRGAAGPASNAATTTLGPPPEAWADAVLRYSEDLMRLGGCCCLSAAQLLQLGGALAGWQCVTGPGWGEAFLDATEACMPGEQGPGRGRDRGLGQP